MTRQDTVPVVSFGVLGAVTAWADGVPVGLKGPRHRAVLARLLVARGRVVPVDQFLADLWHAPSEGSVAAIRTFVADLRRALEPDRPARRPARLLITAPTGYALRAPADAVDAWRFEAAVVNSGRLLGDGRPEAALTGLEEALALWRGPAYAGYDSESWARGEINRLDDLRLLGGQRRAEALMALGRDVEAAAGLRADAEAYPLREDIWRLWVVALYRSGRQGEALAALRRVRETLVDELGVDPGPRLRQLEADILRQAPHLAPTTPTATATPVPTTSAALPTFPARADGTAPEHLGGPAQRPFVGREPEMDRLVRVAAGTTPDGGPAVALVCGDAGAGKTALLDALTRRLSVAGWVTAWGRSPEYDGAPAAWPWTQISEALTAAAGSQPRDPRPPLAGTGRAPGGDGGGPSLETLRFRLRREAVSLVDAAARRAPVLLVLDDLHRADEGTLDLLTGLLAEPESITGPVLVVAAYRTSQVNVELTAALARLAPREPVRVHLTGLSEAATAELTRAVVGSDVDAATLRSVHHRSGGNPFFVRELARLLADEGPQALEWVPAGVRDVIRHRLAQLPEPTRTLLRQAAVVGRDVDPEVLSALAGEREPAVLDALDQAEQAGFLSGHGPAGQLRFTHILVRDTLYDDLPAVRRARWHAAAADALERLHPHRAAALAHHFSAAGTRATAARAARYARSAAEQAEARAAPHDAARLWEQAITAYDRVDGDVPGRLVAQMGLGRALAVTGRLAQARRHRAAAIVTARRLDDPDLLANVLTAFDVPAIWTRNDDEQLSRQVVLAVDAALGALPPDDRTRRAHLLATLALELRGTTTDRGERAAREAEEIARQTGDVPLLALALNARYLHTFHRAGLAPERARIGADLAEVARSRNLVTFEVLGHLIAMQAYCAVGDLTAADTRAATADRLARRYELPLVGLFIRWYTALRLAVQGRAAEAKDAYRDAEQALPAAELPGMAQGLAPLALFCLRLTSGGDLTPADSVRWTGEDWGPYEPWVRPLLLLAADRPSEAADALSAVPESPRDLLREARGCLVARAALALGDRARIRSTYADLLPAAGELAGAGSGVLTLGPVARHLGDLAAALGDHEQAQIHYASVPG